MKKFIKLMSFGLVSCMMFSGCVDQNQVVANDGELRLVATSPAVMNICNLLELDLVGIPTTSLSPIPERYADVVEVGGAMAPNYEQIALLKATDVISPKSLEADLKAQADALNLNSTFLDLVSVQGLYDGIELLGEKYDREEIAEEIIIAYEEQMKIFEEISANQEDVSVMVLMGFPGAYTQATSLSYVGNLVELAGGTNVVPHNNLDFVSLNTEELITMNPEYILWTAHAMPDEVEKMFQEEFATNDIWKHFDAVKNGNLIQLDFSIFNMSANFEWATAISFLQDVFGDS